MTPKQLFEKAFYQGRAPRSRPYREGVLEYLEFMIENKPIGYSYIEGTPEYDAFYAGIDEGRRIWLTEMNERERWLRCAT